MGKIIIEELFGKIKCSCDNGPECNCCGNGWYLGKYKVKACSKCGEVLNETELVSIIETTNEDGIKICDYDCKEWASGKCTVGYVLHFNPCPFAEITEVKRLKKEISRLKKILSKKEANCDCK